MRHTKKKQRENQDQQQMAICTSSFNKELKSPVHANVSSRTMTHNTDQVSPSPTQRTKR